MSKDKRAKRKHLRAQRVPSTQPETPSAPSEASPEPVRPPGQRLWEMPYSAPAPRLINPARGLHNLVARAGHNAGYDIDVTLLDAPDHRLIRSGVLLAHRVLEGRGEWYLGAPDWVPLLPEERIDPMSHGDLPEELADLVRPFRRRAALGPVAALSCERREFALRDDKGTTLALLRDDKVTVRRGGLTTARYREVMLTPVGPGLTSEQDAWLVRTLGAAGATEVSKFPRLVRRLGAPSTGPTDFPAPQPLDEQAPFAQFVATLFAARLRELLEADLAVQAGRPGAAASLADAAGRLRRSMAGLADVLAPEWLEDLDEELAWLAAEAKAEDQQLAASGRLTSRLRGERYLTLLDRLVTAVRTPHLGGSGAQPAGEVLPALLDSSVQRLAATADRLALDSSPEDWTTACASCADLAGVCEIYGLVTGDRVLRLRSRLEVLTGLLAEVAEHSEVAARTRTEAAEASPADAFELGRRYEQELHREAAAKKGFLRHWAKTAAKIAA